MERKRHTQSNLIDFIWGGGVVWYHPWFGTTSSIKVQKEREKIINDKEELHLRVEKETCENCGNVEYASCGVDDIPEEGLRKWNAFNVKKK